MKQFIILVAILPLMMIFVMQFGLSQLNNHRTAMMQEHVYAAKEAARQDGFFTPENCKKLKSKLSKEFGISPDEIEIITDGQVKYRRNYFDERELVNYEVRVPIKKIMAGEKILGISPDKNRGYYKISGTVASELLEPGS